MLDSQSSMLDDSYLGRFAYGLELNELDAGNGKGWQAIDIALSGKLVFIRQRGRGINRARTTALLPREKHIHGSSLRPYFSTISMAIFSSRSR